MAQRITKNEAWISNPSTNLFYYEYKIPSKILTSKCNVTLKRLCQSYCLDSMTKQYMCVIIQIFFEYDLYCISSMIRQYE